MGIDAASLYVNEWGIPLEESFIEESTFKVLKKTYLDQGVDSVEIDRMIDSFKKSKQQNKIKDKEKIDLKYWQNQDFKDFKDFVISLEQEKTKTQAKKEVKVSGAEKVAENEDWLVYRIKSHGACVQYGAETKWCITTPTGEHWKEYTKKNNFYFYIRKEPIGDEWDKIAAQVGSDGSVVYWDARDNDHSSVSRELNIPNVKFEVPEIGIEVNGKQMSISEFVNSDGLKVSGDLNLYDTPITSLPSGLKVGGSLYLSRTKITSLPSGLKVGGSLELYDTPITSLPKDLKVGGSLDLSGTQITSLPSGLKVGGRLDLSGTQITSLPSGLKVGGQIIGFKGEKNNS